MSEEGKPSESKSSKKSAKKKEAKKLRGNLDLQGIADLLADDRVTITLTNGQEVLIELPEVGPEDEDAAEAIEASIANIANDIAEMDEDEDYEDEDELDEDAETDFDEDDDSDEE